MCREILFHQPYQQKKGSVESKKVWEAIHLKMSALPDFDFNLKPMRDHFNNIRDKRKPEVKKDANKTDEGIDTRIELQILLDELNAEIEEKIELQTNENEEKRNKKKGDVVIG